MNPLYNRIYIHANLLDKHTKAKLSDEGKVILYLIGIGAPEKILKETVKNLDDSKENYEIRYEECFGCYQITIIKSGYDFAGNPKQCGIKK